jgi:phosphatidylglycerophosphatase A
MMNLYKWIASCFGIGYIKGGGTIAALVTCIGWWLVQADGSFQIMMIPATAAIIILGIWTGNRVEKDWGKDSSRVVIDEVAGMCISLLFIPVSIQWVLIGLVLFRFFDIVKPFYIRKAEALPAGWGVMADDVLAGVYSNLVLQIIIYLV